VIDWIGRALVSLLSFAIGVLTSSGKKAGLDTAAPILKVGGASLTIDQLVAARAALPDLGVAISHVIAGKATWNDGEVIGDDVLEALAAVYPPAAALAAIGEVALRFAPIALAHVHVHVTPDPRPMADAQTTETPHTGRRA
jgi:hypothetical protein